MWKRLLTSLGFLLIVVYASSASSIDPYKYGEDALDMAKLSYCSSLTSTTIVRIAPDLHLLGSYDPPSKESTQSVVFNDEDEDMYISFRGTQKSVMQWTSNLKADYKKWYGGRVHTGFYDRFLEVRDWVVDKIDSVDSPKHIVISGHSMGGAVATLMASHLCHISGISRCRTIHLYTFGSPRVGDSSFAKLVDAQLGDRHLRVMNTYDMVVEMPPKLLGYRHTGVMMVCPNPSKNEEGQGCTTYGRLDENPGGAIVALKRAIETAKNPGKWHLTYWGERIGTASCISS